MTVIYAMKSDAASKHIRVMIR